MGFIAPAVHYSALATLPPELTSSKSQQSIKHTTNIRLKLGQIFKKLLNNEHTSTTEIEQQIHHHLPETIEKENETLTLVKNPNNNNSDNRISTGSESLRSIPSLIKPLERLPFTEPYFSIAPKNEKFSLELSAYHKHCIRQQKYIDQKQYHQKSSSIKENRSDLTNYRLRNSIDEQHKIKSNSTATLPESTSIENRLGLQYASQKNTITTNQAIRSSYPQRLRRLHSKSKIRPIANVTKPSSSISSSIAHRIELLKQSMHNPQLEVHRLKREKCSSIESSSSPLIDTIHRQTQTNVNQLKSSEIHHIHYHHIYSSSIEWRTYLSILGIFSILFLFLIQLITIIF